MGIGSPIITDGEVLGSVTLVFSKGHGRFLDHRATGLLLREKCTEFEKLLDVVNSFGNIEQ